MKKILLFLLLILNFNISDAAILNNSNNQFKRYAYHPTKHYTRPLPIESINALEKYSLNRVYKNDNPISRLERLETEAFGAVQHGDLISRYENVEAALLSRPKNYYSPKRSLINNIATFFAGQPTGITPPIGINPQFNSYPYGYNTIYPNQGNSIQNYDTYSNGLFNRGYNVYNNNTGNGASIRILD